MHWLLLRGLAREQRHYGAFPETLARLVPGVVPHTIDLPGFGTESARMSPVSIAAIVDDVRARFAPLRAAHAGPWSIFAISLGGMVALDWAARFPSDFARVVVANTSAADLSPPWHRFSTSLWPKLPGIVAGDAVSRERAILGISSNRSASDNEALASQWAGFYGETRPHRRSFARQLVAATRSRLPRAIEPPVLVLTSRADRLVSHLCSLAIAKALRAPVVVHDEAGHDITLDAPAWVCDQLVAGGAA